MEFLFASIHEIRWGLTIAGTVGLILFVRAVGRDGYPVKTNRSYKTASRIVTLVFLLLAGYQARWQLFGFFRPDFLRVQRGFDPRGEILGMRFHRGALLDRNYRPLATDVKSGGYLRREYSLGEAAVHVVGYNHSKYGSAGMEKELESLLMGRAVRSPADVLRLAGNAVFHRTLRGNPVVLTLDRDLQQAAFELLGNHTGSIVAIDPRDGSIRAMASRPGFDPGSIDDRAWDRLLTRTDSPFLNRAIQGLYPPGSTFKILVAATSVQNRLDPVYICGPGGFDCGPADPRVRDHAHYADPGFQGHGRLNLTEALSLSCNVYFAYLAEALTAPVILETAREAGLDRRVLFNGPGPGGSRGRLPGYAKWHVARTVRLGIGQDDVLLTPLHLAVLAGTIGNGGLAVKPRMVETQVPALPQQVFETRTANQVARMMMKSVETGTGRSARMNGIITGGKTGTAESSGRRSHALFVCFAPWPRPALAIAVVIEHGGMGGAVAAPLAGELLRRADELGLLEDREIHRGGRR